MMQKSGLAILWLEENAHRIRKEVGVMANEILSMEVV